VHKNEQPVTLIVATNNSSWKMKILINEKLHRVHMIAASASNINPNVKLQTVI
jgi:hypothetical protein